MSELKPCPFCGADNGYVDVIPNPFSNDIYSRGHCIKCHAVGTFYVQSYLEGELRPSFEQMAQMATEQWNTRPIEDELNRRIAELEAAQRWIPVSERLPEDKKHYMTVVMNCYDGSRDIYRLRYYGNGDWFSWASESNVVTHWKEEPALPEVQE